MNIPDTKIAVTLYNLREYCQNESDLDCTLDKLCDIGFQAVQVSGTPLDAALIRKQLDKHGLICMATHEKVRVFENDISPVVDYMQTLGCDFTALGAPPQEYRCKFGFEKLCRIFNRQGEKFLASGIKLGYHNHHIEFTRFPGMKRIALEEFYANTNPETVFAELDVHWIARGGGDPAYWIRKVAGRMPVLHIKDFTIYNGEPVFCEIGEGNLNWEAIFAAAEATGVRWYSIEQDAPFPGHDIFDSMRTSFNNLKAMGIK